jgi:hypothetical protein
VLVIAVIAVRSPNGRGTAAGRVTDMASAPTSPSSPSSPPSSSSAGAKRAPTKPAKTTKRAVPTKSSSTPAVAKLPLVVLNNTTVTGLAATARGRFEAGGWTVTSIGNLRGNILSTCAYYDPSQPSARAAALALQAQFPSIRRVAPKFAELPAGPIVVVLTADYS